MKKSSQILKIQHPSKGFTLVELLLAMSLSLVVLTLAGSGLVSIMNANQKAETASARRINLTRALDFIADEVRGANKVSSVPTGSTFPGSGTGVLLITLPATITPNPNRVYFVSSTYNDWAGPNTINRAELPSTYSSGSITVASGSEQLLVDGITTPTTPPTCASGFTLTGANGFYACIGPDNRTVDLYLYGKLSNTNSTTYQATTRVFARSN